jgi:ABC-type Fe3+-siderophore transport system permease subunit
VAAFGDVLDIATKPLSVLLCDIQMKANESSKKANHNMVWSVKFPQTFLNIAVGLLI